MTKLQQYKELRSGRIDYTFFYEGIAPFEVCEICGGLSVYEGKNVCGYNWLHYCTVNTQVYDYYMSRLDDLGVHTIALEQMKPTDAQLKGLYNGLVKIGVKPQ